MNCKKCGYSLWNLAPGPCPECGTVFRPSDYRLRVNACRFICPTAGCGQDYYGTDEQGHLEPSAFVCVKCGRGIEMDAMLVLPTVGVDERITKQEGLLWADRRDRGWVRAFWGTFGTAIGNPHRLGRDVMSEACNPLQARVFSAICTLLFGVVGIGPLFVVLPMSQIAGLGVQGRPQDMLMFVGYLLLAFLVPALVLWLGLQVWGLLSHAALLVALHVGHRTEAKRDSEMLSLGRTMEMINYSAPALLLVGVPCFGIILAPLGVVWLWVASAFALSQVPGVRQWRALVAVGVWPLLVVVGVVVWMIVMG